MGFFERAKRALFGGEDAAQAPTQPVKSPEQVFAEEVLGVLRAHERVTRAEPDPEAIFTLHVWIADAQEPGQVFLHNLRKDTLDCDLEQRRAMIERFVSSMTESRESDWESAQGNLVPVLRTATFVGFVEAAPYPIWVVATEDSYESSRLAAPGWLAAQRDNKEHFMVPFDDVQEIAGELMVEEPGMLPRRWRLESFPEGSMLEALREAAEEP